jgi:hypothetical protein
VCAFLLLYIHIQLCCLYTVYNHLTILIHSVQATWGHGSHGYLVHGGNQMVSVWGDGDGTPWGQQSWRSCTCRGLNGVGKGGARQASPLLGAGQVILQRGWCSRHDFTHIRGWMQMVLAPNDLFSWNKNTVRHGLWWGHIIYIMLLICTKHNSTHSVTGPSPVSLFILLCLPSSTVRNQLLLITLLWGTGAPYPQGGVPFPRIRAYSLP